VGPTCQAGVERGEGGLRWGRFLSMEAEIGQGGRHLLVGLLGQWREAATWERVGRCGSSGSAGPKSKEVL
jgi:hypothetical protein